MTVVVDTRWEHVEAILATTLTDHDRARLTDLVQRTANADRLGWDRAWTAALHCRDTDLLRAAFDRIWIPRLEGTRGAVALWGAALAAVLGPALDEADRDVLAGPWQAFCDSRRNIFGDGAI